MRVNVAFALCNGYPMTNGMKVSVVNDTNNRSVLHCGTKPDTHKDILY